MKSDKFYFTKAAEQAKSATCHRAKCGTVIVAKDGEIIGEGFNAPPLNDESQRTCDAEWEFSRKPKYDKTCCIHAEWNAIFDALKNFGSRIDGGTLYFMRIDDNESWTNAGEPFCTVCSRLAIQSGLKNFALWTDDKAKVYDVADYNYRSYEFHKKANHDK